MSNYRDLDTRSHAVPPRSDHPAVSLGQSITHYDHYQQRWRVSLPVWDAHDQESIWEAEVVTRIAYAAAGGAHRESERVEVNNAIGEALRQIRTAGLRYDETGYWRTVRVWRVDEVEASHVTSPRFVPDLEGAGWDWDDPDFDLDAELDWED